MRKCVCLSAMFILLLTAPAGAALVFYDSFTRGGDIVGSVPDIGGGAYDHVPSGYTDVKYATGGSAYLANTSDHSGSFINFSVRTPVTGVNYAWSSVFCLTATFNSSDISEQYSGHLGVELGIDVSKMGGGSLVREQQIGLGQSGWYSDLGAAPHTVAWGSGSFFGRHSLGDYTLGNTVTVALKFEEKLMDLPTTQYSYKVYAGAVPPSGDEPAWTEIAGEGNKPGGYSVDYIGLIVGGRNGGYSDPQTHSGHIDEIRIGKTWADVQIVPTPNTVCLLAAGLALLGLRRRT